MKNISTILFLIISISSIAQNNDWFDDYVRRIHMDFHTPEFTQEKIMKDFDAKKYVRVLKDAHVNSLVTFAKGHHGNSYYDTKLGHKHQSLPNDVDMMGEIIEECHKNDMKVLTYYSVGWLTTVELNNPEWMERDVNGQKMGTGGSYKPDQWNCICLNAPYLEKVVLPEMREIVSNYDMDAIWIDIIENNPCYCESCKAKYKKEHGHDYPNHEAAIAFAAQTKYEAIEKMINAVKEIKPAVVVSYNTAGRDPAVVELVDFTSVETHPGATWHQSAWTHALLTMKLLQQYNIPWESTTSRFIHGWGGWDDQTTENMMAVASRIIAHGGVINLGDQTYPNGQLDKALYKKIGEVFGKIATMEPWALNTETYSQIGLFVTPFDIYSIYGQNPEQMDKYLGATKILSDKQWHFDLILEGNYKNLNQYKCLVLPNVGSLSAKSAEDIKAYVQQGGKVLLTGTSSLDEENESFALAEPMGLEFTGWSKHNSGYLDLVKDVAANTRRSYLMVPAQFAEIEVNKKATILSGLINPIIQPKPEELFFFRNNKYSPPGAKAKTPAIVANNFGKGQVIYCAAPIFETFQTEGQWYLKDVANNLLNYLLSEREVKVEAPGSVEVVLRKKDGHLVIHLINYIQHKETNQVEEVYPAHNIQVQLSNDLFDFSQIELVGENNKFDVEKGKRTTTITLDEVQAYSQLVVKLK